jgi:hypothetical protein
MLIVGFLSFVLTPVTIGVGAWAISKNKIDRRIKVLITYFVVVRIATVLTLLGMAIVGGAGSGGWLPH